MKSVMDYVGDLNGFHEAGIPYVDHSGNVTMVLNDLVMRLVSVRYLFEKLKKFAPNNLEFDPLSNIIEEGLFHSDLSTPPIKNAQLQSTDAPSEEK